VNCPDCGADNIQGAFACEECGRDLAGLDIPEGQPMHGLRRHIMREGRHGSVLVVDPRRDNLVGIFTERDVLIRVWGAGLDVNTTPVHRVMTPDPVALKEDDIVAYAIHLMGVRGFRHIPIVRDGHPVGFVSVRGILRYISEQVLTEE